MARNKVSNITTLADAYQLYLSYLNSTGCALVAQTKTALIRYTLPGWGFQIANTGKLSSEAINQSLEFMREVSLQDFATAISVQQRVYDALGDDVTSASKRNYRCALKRMLDWCQTQTWWKDSLDNSAGKCTPRISTGRDFRITEIRVTNRKKQSPYSLTRHEFSPRLEQELDNLHKFMTEPYWFGRQDKQKRPVTAKYYIEYICCYLGWLYRIKGVPLEEMSLEKLISFMSVKDYSVALEAARQDMRLCYEYLSWLQKERNLHPGSQIHVVKSLLVVAKFFYHNDTNSPLIKNFQDVPVVSLLRTEINELGRKAKVAPRAIDISKKWLDWEELVAFTQHLKLECAERKNNGGKRPESAIASSYQRYLMLAFLVYMPPQRQRVFRELEQGRTLVKIEGVWHIHLMPEDSKTGETYGETWLRVPEIIYPELETWLNKWRVVFNPKHNFVFTQLNGSCFIKQTFANVVRQAAFRITGQALTPHLIRDIVVTHFSRHATEAEMESLALGMHHSRETQKKLYDFRTQEEKIALALNMVLRAASIDVKDKQ